MWIRLDVDLDIFISVTTVRSRVGHQAVDEALALPHMLPGRGTWHLVMHWWRWRLRWHRMTHRRGRPLDRCARRLAKYRRSWLLPWLRWRPEFRLDLLANLVERLAP